MVYRGYMHTRVLIQKFISLARATWDIKECEDGLKKQFKDVNVANYLHGEQV